MIRLPSNRQSAHPGEMLLEEFLTPMNLTQRELAEAIHVPYQRVNEIINGKRGVTPATASAPGTILRHVSRVLDEFAVAVGSVLYPTGRG